jgi:hypothetical protein
MQAFNFDDWADLYQTDPAAFEKRRQEVLEAMISAAPIADDQKQQLRATLFAVSVPLKDPLTLMADAQALMWSSFRNVQEVFKTVHVSANQDGSVSCRPTAVAQFTR